jgi:hypothetical protein
MSEGLGTKEVPSVSTVELVGNRMEVEVKMSSFLARRREEEALQSPGLNREQGAKASSP